MTMNPPPVDTKEEQAAEQIQIQPNIKPTPRENRVINSFNASPLEWEDWKWQLRNRIRTKDVLAKLINLTPEEEKGIDGSGTKLTMSIPPYFASLIDPDDPQCPIRLQSVPLAHED